jgi:hypothetical protein
MPGLSMGEESVELKKSGPDPAGYPGIPGHETGHRSTENSQAPGRLPRTIDETETGDIRQVYPSSGTMDQPSGLAAETRPHGVRLRVTFSKRWSKTRSRCRSAKISKPDKSASKRTASPVCRFTDSLTLPPRFIHAGDQPRDSRSPGWNEISSRIACAAATEESSAAIDEISQMIKNVTTVANEAMTANKKFKVE